MWKLEEKFEFRNIDQEEADQAAREQADALRCLNLAKEKIATLEERIWRGINE